jgi:CubicO group peptidase (beta-lactamase class C family)
MAGRVVTSLVILLFVFSSAAVSAPPQASAQADDAPAYERIDAFVEDSMRESSIPGVALTVVQDGQTVHSAGYGKTSDNGRLVTPQTPFIIGSTTKSITALAVMQLVEAGLIDLDSPVQHYIPEFTLAGADEASRISVRHLLTMSSGIPASAGGEAFRSTVNMSPEAAVRALVSTHLAFEPGSEFEYVNANYVILGLLIQNVSGQTYGDYLQQRIFDPLEMHHSYTDPAAARTDGFADGHRYWFGRPVAYETPYLEAMVPAGYVISTSEDLSNYLQLFLNNGSYNGENIISPESIAEMHQPVHEFPLGPWADGAQAWYAMGWLVGGPWGDQPTVFHTGASPSFTATLHLKPDQQMGVVTLMNSGNYVPLPVAQDAMRQIPRGVMSLLTGGEPARSSGINRFYLFFNLAVIVVVGLQGAALVRLVRRRINLNGGRLATTRLVVPFVWEIGLGTLILAAPAMVASWRFLWVWTPDLALLAVIVATLWLTTGLTRAVRIGFAISRGRPAQTSSSRYTPEPLPAHD